MNRFNVKLIFGLLIILLQICCTQRKADGLKEMNFYSFSITTPKDWEKVKQKGIDSKVGYILTSNKDTIHYSLGKHVSKFKVDSKVFHDSVRNDFISFKHKDVFRPEFSKTPEYDNALGTHLKEYYYYKIINGRKTLFKIPKQPNIGGTAGIFIDSLNGNNKLVVWGRDIPSKDLQDLIKSFESIKINKTSNKI